MLLLPNVLTLTAIIGVEGYRARQWPVQPLRVPYKTSSAKEHARGWAQATKRDDCKKQDIMGSGQEALAIRVPARWHGDGLPAGGDMGGNDQNAGDDTGEDTDDNYYKNELLARRSHWCSQ